MIFSTAMVLATLQWNVGPRVALVADGGDGVAHVQCERNYALGLGASVTTPVVTHAVALQGTMRGHWWAPDPGGCPYLRPPPPTNGVFIESDRVNLLAAPFVTTDVRLARLFGEDAALAIGAGNAWRDAHDFPYALAAVSAQWHSPAHVAWGFDVEYHLMRVTWTDVQRTYQNGTVVAEQSLGESHKLSHALLIGFHVTSPL